VKTRIVFDWPWDMVRLRDWFFYKNCAVYNGTMFSHFRVLGIRLLKTIN
jgi:hypothetical protein